MMIWVFRNGMTVTIDNCQLMKKGVVTVLGKVLVEAPCIPHYHIWKRYYENKSCKDLKNNSVTLEGKLLLQYIGGRHIVMYSR